MMDRARDIYDWAMPSMETLNLYTRHDERGITDVNTVTMSDSPARVHGIRLLDEQGERYRGHREDLEGLYSGISDPGFTSVEPVTVLLEEGNQDMLLVHGHDPVNENGQAGALIGFENGESYVEEGVYQGLYTKEDQLIAQTEIQDVPVMSAIADLK